MQSPKGWTRDLGKQEGRERKRKEGPPHLSEPSYRAHHPGLREEKASTYPAALQGYRDGVHTLLQGDPSDPSPALREGCKHLKSAARQRSFKPLHRWLPKQGGFHTLNDESDNNEIVICSISFYSYIIHSHYLSYPDFNPPELPSNKTIADPDSSKKASSGKYLPRILLPNPLNLNLAKKERGDMIHIGTQKKKK
eukprot:bmy_13611T0